MRNVNNKDLTPIPSIPSMGRLENNHVPIFPPTFLAVFDKQEKRDKPDKPKCYNFPDVPNSTRYPL